ncbi:hypothetical protein MBLNU230_g0038t1 [Neophaeotheca triangularis]
MLGSPAPATTTLSTLETTPASPTRPSRLRGLSYLRSYTSNHLHSHLGGTSSRSDAPQFHRSTSSPGQPHPGNTQTQLSQASQPRARQAAQDNGESHISTGENGWLPNVQDRSLTSTSTDSASPERTTTAAEMARSQASTSTGPTPTATLTNTVRRTSAALASGNSESPSAAMSSSAQDNSMPTIKFIPHVEARASRPSLEFDAMSRTLRTPTTVVKVGRYSERDTTPSDPSVLPVGFKSKVVSRRHCQFWCASGQWYTKDVGSSSGTFLNHVRLSSPGVESRPYPVNDGDVVQLGIDFKGGEEVIFRCVKIRIECNRGWQKSLNNFNTSTHKRLLKSATTKKSRDSDAASVNSSECSICLNPVAPCQALFVAPCSHVWHYKCVRNLIDSPSWPNFLCPNCRFVADLEADVEQPEETTEEWEELYDEDAGTGQEHNHSGKDSNEGEAAQEGAEREAHSTDQTDDRDRDTARTPAQTSASITDDELSGLLTNTSISNPSDSARQTVVDQAPSTSQEASTTPSIPISQRPAQRTTTSSETATTPTSTSQFALASGSYTAADGPMTPRNEAVFVVGGESGGREDRLDGIVRETVMEEGEGGEDSDGSAGSRGTKGSRGSRGSGGTAEGNTNDSGNGSGHGGQSASVRV